MPRCLPKSLTTPGSPPTRLGTAAIGLLLALTAVDSAAAQDGASQRPAEIQPTDKGTEDAPQRPALAEGAFLVKQPGMMAPLQSGGWAFVFDRNDRGLAPAPPMALLPCATLERMEQLVPPGEDRVSLLVTGQVFLYQNRNFLLPTMFSFPPEEENELGEDGSSANAEETQSDAETSDERQEQALRRAESADPSVEALIESIETLSEDRPEPVWAPPSGPGEHVGLRPDGSYLQTRRGRLISRENGNLAFTINTDADQAPGLDAPLIVLPCLNRERMERLIERRGKGLSMVVSGRVFSHGGRNYLIPTMFQVATDQGLGLRSAR